MKTVSRIFIGLGILIVLLAVLSLTVLNKHFAPTRVEILMRDGRLAEGDRDYGAAVDHYLLAVGLSPRNVDAYLHLSEALIYSGDVDGAIYYLERGMRKTSSSKLRDALNALLGKQAGPSSPDRGSEPDPSSEPLPSPLPEEPSIAEPSPEGPSPEDPPPEEPSPEEPSPGDPSPEDASPSGDGVL